MTNLPKPGGLRLLLIDDHPIVLEALCKRINSEADLSVVGMASKCEEALEMTGRVRPDVILTDLKHSEGESALDTIKEIHQRLPEVPILVFSGQQESVYAPHCLRLGASGYLSKSNDGEEVMRAIRKVAAGGKYLSPAVSEQIVRQRVANAVGSASDLLSAREFEVFELIGMGKKSKEIAGELGISLKTVETHRAHIKDKLGLEAGASLIQFASKWFATSAGHQGLP